jgi:hypothetical protein
MAISAERLEPENLSGWKASNYEEAAGSGKSAPWQILISGAKPMDWAAVNWVNVGLLAAFAFLASLIGNILAFNSRLFGAILTAILFAAIFVLWTYYPHGFALPNVKVT